MDFCKSSSGSLTYFGLQGYLVTVTSSGENAFCQSKLSGNGWMGANDAATEGTWKWVTGPENWTQFYSGQYPTGTCRRGNFVIGQMVSLTTVVVVNIMHTFYL